MQTTNREVREIQPTMALSAQQLVDRLGVSLRHVRRLDCASKLPRPIRLGASVRWAVSEIETWLEAGAPDRRTWQAIKESPR